MTIQLPLHELSRGLEKFVQKFVPITEQKCPHPEMHIDSATSAIKRKPDTSGHLPKISLFNEAKTPFALASRLLCNSFLNECAACYADRPWNFIQFEGNLEVRFEIF